MGSESPFTTEWLPGLPIAPRKIACSAPSFVADYAIHMTHRATAVIVLLVPMAILIGTVLIVRGHAQEGPVYTLAQVQGGLYRTPQAWVSQTVRVRAKIEEVGPYGTSQTAASPSWRYVNLLNMPLGLSMEIILGPVVSPHASPSISYPAVNLDVLDVGTRTPNTLLSLLQRLPVVQKIVPVPNFESTPQNIWSPHVFVLHLLPRGQAFDATLINVE